MKYTEYEENELYSILKPVCSGYGAAVVHLSTAIVKKTLQVRIVLHKKGGIGIDECSEVSRAVLPRIEIWSEDRDVSLEVSSPGIGRTLKDAFEFRIFTGEKVKLLINEQWMEGKILNADNKSVTVEIGKDTQDFQYETIAKAKLN